MTLAPGKPVRISVLSTPSHLSIVRSAAEKMCELIGFDSDATGAVVLSIDEAMTNIIKHAYNGEEDKIIEIELSVVDCEGIEGLQVLLRDCGRVVDTDQIKSRDLADIRPGGLGVHIMTECMDELEYSHPEGGGTLLKMVKLLSAQLQPHLQKTSNESEGCEK